MSKSEATSPSRAARELGIDSLSREELHQLTDAVNRELESRAFEANLKRELTSYKRRSG
jgi:hypothetical protein